MRRERHFGPAAVEPRWVRRLMTAYEAGDMARHAVAQVLRRRRVDQLVFDVSGAWPVEKRERPKLTVVE